MSSAKKHDSDIIDGGDPQALLEAAERLRGKQAQREAQPSPSPVASPALVKKMREAPGDESAPPSSRVRKRVVARRRAISTDTLGDDDGGQADPSRRAAKKSAKKSPAPPRSRNAKIALGVWGFAAVSVALALLTLTLSGLRQVPSALPVGAVRISWLAGPQLPSNEVFAWLHKFPERDKLSDPNAWVLNKLADYLRELPAVGRVEQVRLVHEPVNAKGTDQGLRRVLELVIGLRRPVMPVMLSSGERAWVDAEGKVLPGILPAPAIKRPMLRSIEAAGASNVIAALNMWMLLEPQIERGLVTDIVLNDTLDERGARGIVLYTRQGSRLLWGDPSEERFGVKADVKARQLAHTLRCQGDLSRIAMINVRFSQPFFTLRN